MSGFHYNTVVLTGDTYMAEGAVFFDYDGTLVDEREGIYTPIEKTIEAIRKLYACWQQGER